MYTEKEYKNYKQRKKPKQKMLTKTIQKPQSENKKTPHTYIVTRKHCTEKKCMSKNQIITPNNNP